MKGQVTVRLKPEVLDPQGVTISKALSQLGHDGIVDLRQGKVFDVELEADSAAEAEEVLTKMAEELLANPVIETFEVRILGTDGDGADS